MTTDGQRLLITGATGKVGRSFLRKFRDVQRFESWRLRVLCHNRLRPATDDRRGVRLRPFRQ